MENQDHKRMVAYVVLRHRPAKSDGLKQITFITILDENRGTYRLGFTNGDLYDKERLEREFQKQLYQITPTVPISWYERAYIRHDGAVIIAKKEKPDEDEDARVITAFRGKNHPAKP